MKIVFLSLLVLCLSSCGDDKAATVPVIGSTGQGDEEQTTPECTNCRLFVTDATYNGNLGGIAGADQKCASDINNPNDGAVFKALVVGSTRRACTSINCLTSGASENLDWVMKPNTNYIDLSGNALFTTGVGGVPVYASFSSSRTASSDKIWTGLAVVDTGGLSAYGDWLNLETCSDWSDENAQGGTYGGNILTNPGYGYGNFSFFAEACTSTNSLYCIEQ